MTLVIVTMVGDKVFGVYDNYAAMHAALENTEWDKNDLNIKECHVHEE